MMKIQKSSSNYFNLVWLFNLVSWQTGKLANWQTGKLASVVNVTTAGGPRIESLKYRSDDNAFCRQKTFRVSRQLLTFKRKTLYVQLGNFLIQPKMLPEYLALLAQYITLTITLRITPCLSAALDLKLLHVIYSKSARFRSNKEFMEIK